MTKLCEYFDYIEDPDGNSYIEVYVKGIALLRMPGVNKGTAFTSQERQALGLEGLLPPQVVTLDRQVERIYCGYKNQADDLAKYQFLRGLQERSEVAFYALLERHLEEMLPIVYTPTVGKAVQQYSYLYQVPRGLSLSPENIQRVDDVIGNYPWNDVRMIVATDSSAILGIGDQGYGGLAIAIGKLALYSAGGGVSPYRSMPVSLDVGTDRKELLEDPNYLGTRQHRLRGEEYDAFIDRFVDGVLKRWPRVILQWEDLAKEVAFAVLERYRHRLPSFNDDIQGTGAVVLGGLLSACRNIGKKLVDQRIIIFGAGASGVGVAKMIINGMEAEGLSESAARSRLYVLDSKGLIVEGSNQPAYKHPVMHPANDIEDWQYAGQVPSLLEVVEHSQSTVLIGLSGQYGAFSKPIVDAMQAHCAHPMIFPLSNPTASCEARPDDLFQWTAGHVTVATGSPFPDVEFNGERHVICQGNNAFIFPGLGLAAMLGECTEISNQMVLKAALALADYCEKHIDTLVYPPMQELQAVSLHVATEVLKQAIDEGSARHDPGADVQGFVAKNFWRAKSLPYRAG